MARLCFIILFFSFVVAQDVTWPLRGILTSAYGYRNLGTGSNFHYGIDIAAPQGTAVVSATPGVVSYAGWHQIYGNVLVVGFDGFNFLYGHCAVLYVRQGETVAAGQIIAAVGATGVATGPHLHFETREGEVPFDPLEFLRVYAQ
jgi:murein DD-endopeptidase MepM/ murein hydrolase activator NlpD